MSDKPSFEKTPLNQVKRVPNRGVYDHDSVFRVFDESWICHVGFAGEEYPTVIPMLHVRVDDEIVFHGATSSRLMKMLASGSKVCLSAAMVDGLVMARSLFHHSMNYRSAVAFGTGRLITSEAEVTAAFKALSDKVMEGRWDDARQPSNQELKATALVGVKIESGSAKIRTGGPVDDAEDMNLPVWAGVVPIQQTLGALEPASNLIAGVEVPAYLDAFCQSRQ
ncbi:MAG: nitroimidazol reductase NimA-like FMN-containing flavoprotein [Mariniblastus sp.]|jgi:nitroimidazol reductase NimA-like FMN-containing flavoprotein (pyridoxamine 5'-phosphate oxidase superfamily)